MCGIWSASLINYHAPHRSPIGAVMLSKLLYNSTKSDVAEAFSKASKVIQVKDSSRLTYDEIKQQAAQ